MERTAFARKVQENFAEENAKEFIRVERKEGHMNEIKKARLMKELTQAQVAEAAGIHAQSYSAIEKRSVCPKVETAKRLAEVLGIKWTAFYE